MKHNFVLTVSQTQTRCFWMTVPTCGKLCYSICSPNRWLGSGNRQEALSKKKNDGLRRGSFNLKSNIPYPCSHSVTLPMSCTISGPAPSNEVGLCTRVCIVVHGSTLLWLHYLPRLSGDHHLLYLSFLTRWPRCQCANCRKLPLIKIIRQNIDVCGICVASEGSSHCTTSLDIFICWCFRRPYMVYLDHRQCSQRTTSNCTTVYCELPTNLDFFGVFATETLYDFWSSAVIVFRLHF